MDYFTNFYKRLGVLVTRYEYFNTVHHVPYYVTYTVLIRVVHTTNTEEHYPNRY